MDPVNSVIIGLARIRSERRYQLFVEGKQNTIGVRAAGGGGGGRGGCSAPVLNKSLIIRQKRLA